MGLTVSLSGYCYESSHCEEIFIKIERLARAKARSFMHRSGFIARRLGMTEEDLTQEFMIIAWKALAKADLASATLDGFLGKKIHWEAASVARRGFKGANQIWKGNPEYVVEEHPSQPPEISEDAKTMILSRMHRIPSSRISARRHLELTLEGLSAEEIAQREGINPIRVRKNLAMAVKFMRD